MRLKIDKADDALYLRLDETAIVESGEGMVDYGQMLTEEDNVQ